MSSEPQPRPAASPEPRPLDVVREEAARTTTAQVRADLTTLTERHVALAALSGWSVAAEEVFRQVIGKERKAQLEMRVALGEAGQKHLRYTKSLAEMTLPELQAEYPETRRATLKLLDELLSTPGLRAWTFGEEVPMDIYIVALRQRLTSLGNLLVAEKVQG